MYKHHLGYSRCSIAYIVNSKASNAYHYIICAAKQI